MIFIFILFFLLWNTKYMWQNDGTVLTRTIHKDLFFLINTTTNDKVICS